MTFPEIVRLILANHLRVEPTSLHDAKRLRQDLDVTPLDLVWVAMRVEALDVRPGQFPVERLAGAQTVGDLVALFVSWVVERGSILQPPWRVRCSTH